MGRLLILCALMLALPPMLRSSELEREKAAADKSFSQAVASPLKPPLPPKAPPEPEGKAAPLPEYKERYILMLEKGFRLPEGVSPEAKTEASRLLREMHRETPLETLMRLADCRPTFLIIPKGKNFTEFEDFSWVAGLSPEDKTFGIVGRLRGAVRGAAREEALLDAAGNWPRGGVMVHEWAHVVQFCLLMGIKSEFVESSFDRQFEPGKAFANAYAQKNDREYFAEAVSLWFGLHDRSGATDGSDLLDAGWIRRQDIKMYFLLDALFGPPRDLFVPAGEPW